MVVWTIIDDTDPGLVYTGNWNLLRSPVNARNPEYNGTVHATNDPTATVSYNFTGTVLDVFGTIDAPGTYGYPNASFTITPLNTGTPLQHLNETGYVTEVLDMTIATSHLEFFKSGTLPLKNHTMTLVADGVQDGGPTFYLDFLRVAIPTSGKYDSIVVDDAESGWVYSSKWIKGAHVGEYLDTWHSTPLEGGTANLKFYGSNISVYGAFSGQYEADTPLAYISVDDEETPHAITPRNISEQMLGASVGLRNQLVFATSGMPDLGSTPRTLTISVPFIMTEPTPRPIISSPSWFLDYAIYGPYSATPTAASQPTRTSRSSTGTPTETPPASSSPNAGAIAGGVIGALAGVGLIVAALFFWLRKKRKARPLTAIQQEYPASLGQPQPFVLDISHDSPTSPSAWTAGGRGSKGAERVTIASSTSSSQGLRSPTTVSSGHGQSPIGRGSGSGTGRLMQEVDGGVRLATSSNYESEILPPTYAPYER